MLVKDNEETVGKMLKMKVPLMKTFKFNQGIFLE